MRRRKHDPGPCARNLCEFTVLHYFFMESGAMKKTERYSTQNVNRTNTVLKYQKAQFLGYELFLIFRHLQTESVVSLLPPPPPYSSPKIDFSLGGGIQIKISQSKFLEKSEKLQ